MALLALLFTGILLIAAGDSDDTLKKLIIDTDMSTDCDDVGALCLAHSFADAGLVDLLAVVHDTGLPQGVGAISSINNYYGRNDIPVGAFKGEFGSRLPGAYVADLVSRFPGPIHNYTQVPDAVDTYRSVLASQRDRSVTIASIGFLTNIAALLKSQADSHSPLNGTELLEAKVSTVLVMGGKYPSSGSTHEWNFGGGNQDNTSLADPVSSIASSFALANLPKSIDVIFNGFNVGVKIFTGGRLTSCASSTNPCRQAYIDRQGLGIGRESWDPVTVLLSVIGIASDHFARQGDGHCVVDPINGSNEWIASGMQSRNESYLMLKDGQNVSISDQINSLLCKPPRRKFSQQVLPSFV